MGTFRLTRPGADEVRARLERAQGLPDASPRLLSLGGLTTGKRLPLGFTHDFSYSELGYGAEVFARARDAMASWIEFDLGWVTVADPLAPIARGQVVAVLAHTAGLWSVNLSRITETIDMPARFGFLYTTTPMHVEEGQERFVVTYEQGSGAVDFVLEAVARPRHALARLGFPFTRAMQRKFIRDAHARMRQATSGR